MLLLIEINALVDYRTLPPTDGIEVQTLSLERRRSNVGRASAFVKMSAMLSDVGT